MNYYCRIDFYCREFSFECHIRSKIKSSILSNLKGLLYKCRMNLHWNYPYKFIIHCNSIDNVINLFNDIHGILEDTDKTCIPENKLKSDVLMHVREISDKLH